MRQSEYKSRVKESTVAELEQMLKDERENVFKVRQQLALKQLSNTHALGSAKKNIARILSELRAREIGESKGS